MHSWSNKDVLVVSPSPVIPRDYGNRVRIDRICTRLMEAGARIHFLLYPAEADWQHRLPIEAIEAHLGRFRSFHIVPPTRLLHVGADGSHHLVDEWWDPAIGQYLDWLAGRQHFDAAIVNYTWLSRALTHLPETCLKILDTHDRFSGRKELFLANGLAPEFFYTQPDQEAVALERADVVWAIKREEAAFFRKLTDRTVVAVPHIDPVRPLPGPGGEFLTVGLLGANNNLNRENFERFLDDCVEHVRQNLTQFELVVAGSVCKMLRPRPEKFIRFMGYVDSIEEFYSAVDCVVVPMSFSTGLKIKTAEALSFAKPVLALAHAFEGFAPKHAFHQLSSNAGILDAIGQMVRRPEMLTELQDASIAAAEATEQEVREGLAATLAAYRAVKEPTFWIVADAGECEDQPALADHLLEVGALLGRVFPRLGFLFLGSGLPEKDLAGAIAALGQMVVLRDETAVEDDLPATIVAAGAEEVLAQTVGAWIMTASGAGLFAALPQGAAFLSGDALALGFSRSPGARDSGFLDLFAGFSAPQVYCGSQLPAEVFSLLVRSGWDVALTPFLHDGENAPMLAGLREGPHRGGTEPLAALPADAGPVEAFAVSNAILDDLELNGCAAGYQVSGRVPPLVDEILLRAGVKLAPPPVAGQSSGDPLGYDDLDRALRGDSGWQRVCALAATLIDRHDTEAETAGAPPDELAPFGATAAAVAPAPVQVPPSAPDKGPGPTMGFTRFTGSQTLTGQEVYFSQLRVYRPENMAFEALDVQFLNSQFGSRAIGRLSLRFVLRDETTGFFVRRNDCSEDAFDDETSVWQSDQWGRFVFYNLGEVLGSSYGEALAGSDLVALLEVLNALTRVDEAVSLRLSGGLLDSWKRVVVELSHYSFGDLLAEAQA